MGSTREGEQLDPTSCVSKAEEIIGYSFQNKRLIQAALTHPSAVSSGTADESYERLEFLGDSVVGLCVAEEVFDRFPDLPEGGLTRIKVSLVSGTALAEVSERIGLGAVIMFGPSETGTGGRGLASALENVYEAVAGALFLDGGIKVAREWVIRTLGDLISKETAGKPENPKSVLQELLQAHGSLPSYEIVAEDGPPHDRQFTAEVLVDGKVLGTGSGSSKKIAEATAAGIALEKLS